MWTVVLGEKCTKWVKRLVKRSEVKTDTLIFRLHNILTAILLLMCSGILTAEEFVGKPTQCIVDNPDPDDENYQKFMDTFCWISTTFTVPSAFARRPGADVAYPGVGNDYGEEKKYYKYYQWVSMVLFLQAILCYAPKYIWDNVEGGLLKSFVELFNLDWYTCEEVKERKKLVVDYLIVHKERHNYYAIRYWFCEVLCLVNIIVQLYFMNRFFDGEFLSYGWKVMSFSETAQEDRGDPMVYIFPRVTKCTFHKYGASGTIQKHDSLCILPLNIVNEKTYIFIWFWFMILLSLLSMLVIYRAIIISCPSVRPRLLRARNKMVPQEVASAICRKVDVGDWWILYMLGRNMDPLIYREMIMELVKKIETHASNQ